MAGGFNDPFAGGGSGGSSGSGGGFNDPFGGGSAAKKSGGGGILGDLTSAGHYIAKKSEKAASDLKQVPGGVVHFGAGLAKDEWDMLQGKNANRTLGNVEGMGKASAQTLKHPLRDPFMTLLTVAPLASAAGRVAEVGEAAGRTGSLGENLRSFKAPRTLRQGEKEVGLAPTSKNAATRYVQRGYAKTVQGALNKERPGRVATRIAAHGERRIGAQIREAERIRQNMALVPANDLSRAGKELAGRIGKHVPLRQNIMAQRALDLTSQNVMPREAALAHEGWGNAKLAKLYHEMDRQGVLKQDAAGNVAVDAERFPRLAEVDAKLAAAQARGEQIIRQHGLMSDEGARTRIDLPGQLIRGAIPESERARPIYDSRGRGYTSAKTSEGRTPQSPVARASGGTVGKQKSPIGASTYEGEAMMAGRVPQNITRMAAEHLRQLIRYQNTDRLRREWLQTGSTTRRSADDILVREPDKAAPPLGEQAKIAVGKARDTTGELETQKTVAQHLDDMFKGGWKGAQDEADRYRLGMEAPRGYKWVSRNVIGDQASAFAESRGRLGRFGDKTNALVTTMTVYLKLGHIGTRVLTNAALNIVEGSATPLQVIKSGKLWGELSRTDKLRALAASGQHSFMAMPHDGGGKIGTLATGGAQWWAKHADAPFRFNAIAYEARKAGFDTPAKFRDFLNKLEKPDALPAAERARIEEVAKRANRENISYDRLNDKERRFLSRYIWFYPWVKGATAATVRTIFEHPYKSGLGGQFATEGQNVQENVLGQLPTYERGLIPLSGGDNPLTTDFSTFSPYATAANTVDAIARPKTVGGMFSPAYAALVPLIFGINSFGSSTKTPVSDALSELFSPTPEAQILTAFLNRHQDQPKRMFDKTVLSQLERAAGGPAVPRRINKAAANKAYGREKSGG